MSLFKKETKTSFKRDESGRVVDVETTETKPKLSFKHESKTPLYDAAKKKYYQKHPEQTTRYKIKKAGSNLINAIDTMADNYAKNTKKTQHKKPMSKTKSNRSKTKYVIKGGVAYPVAQTKPKSTGKRQNPYSRYDYKNNYNPFGDMFDTGITTSKKNKKNKMREYDIFDNWGF